MVATCSRCTRDGKRARCEAPSVDLSALLERELPAGLQRCAGRPRYKLRLQLEGERTAWVIDTRANPPMVTASASGSEGKVDATLIISRADLVVLVTDPEWDAMKMFFAGRMRIEGDEQAGMDASAWLSLPRSKEGCTADAGK